MNERCNLSTNAAIESAGDATPSTLDWRMLADQRLTRLVDLEHDYSVMRDRLGLLQVDYRQLLVVSEGQLQRVRELEKRSAEINATLDDLARTNASMQASRSWRLTRPLRALSSLATVGKRGISRLLRAMLRVPLLRRVMERSVRLVPGLHARLRSRLHLHG